MAFRNQNCNAMDFVGLKPKFQAAVHYHQKKDYLLELNNFPINQGRLFALHLKLHYKSKKETTYETEVS